MNKIQLYSVFYLLVGFIFLNCGSTKFSVSDPTIASVGPSGVQVGAAQINITPYPGFPMGGYGSGGKIARGKWLDLYVKTTYIQDSKGERLALVSCDLWSVPIGLVLEVGKKLSKEDQPIYHLGSNQILLCATHSHNTQAGYATSEAYNALASPISGFDQHMFDFLVESIVESIKEAIDNKTLANGAISYANIEGLIRNRSIEAFENVDPKVQENIKSKVKNGEDYLSNPDLPAFIHKKEEFEAVDPIVTTLTFTSAANTVATPIAILNFISMHPTVLGHDTEVYSSDVFGISERHLKKRTGFNATIISFINGTEGDISPNWIKQDYKNVLDIGQGIADKILNGITKAQPLYKDTDSLNLKFNIVKIKDVEVAIPLRGIFPQCFENIPYKTAKSPYPGIATIGGAEDGRTLLYSQGMHEGIKSEECIPGHGNKINAINSAVELTFAPLPHILKGIIGASFKSMIEKTAPEVVPVGIYSLGDFSIASIPGEPTTTLGYYIKESIRENAPEYADNHIVIAGLANEYLSYFTTPAEYGKQQYEGASTMYGVHSGSFLEQEITKMAKSKNVFPEMEEIKTKPGKQKSIFQGQVFDPHWNKTEGLANFYVDALTGKPTNKYPVFEYEIPSPVNGDYYKISYPGVIIEKFNPSKRNYLPVTNDLDGTDLITLLIDRKNGIDIWQTVWLRSNLANNDDLYRIIISHPFIATIISNNIGYQTKENFNPVKINSSH